MLCDSFCDAFTNFIQGLSSPGLRCCHMVFRHPCRYLYHEKLVCEASALSFVKGVSHQCHTTTDVLPQGWALRSSKKSTRLSEAQRWYLESKFKVGQETGLKLDPVDIAHDTHGWILDRAANSVVFFKKSLLANCGTCSQTTQNLNKTKTLWQLKRNSRTKMCARWS